MPVFPVENNISSQVYKENYF